MQLKFRFGQKVVYEVTGKEYRIIEVDPGLPYSYMICRNTKRDLSYAPKGGTWAREDQLKASE